MVDRGLVRRSVDAGDLDEFTERIERQAEFLKREIADASLDNADPTIGLEIEVYAVDEDERLTRVPEGVFGDRFNKELGLHNAEINTAPSVLDAEGLEEQAAQIRAVTDDAADRLAGSGTSIVFDSMWTIPPEEGTRAYLSDTERAEEMVLAKNMRDHPRYRAIDNAYLDRVEGVDIELPGVSETFPSILVESLATSIQPHLQVPDADDLPAYYNAAIRTMGPVLSLATNSPFAPPDLYADVDPDRLLDQTYHELRVPVFEQSVNLPGEDAPKKVRFPDDIERTEDTVEKVVEDHTYSPFLREWTGEEDDAESYTDEFWEFDFKRGTYWRWLRAVIGGEPIGDDNDERSIRIEYRPLPTQPTVRDNVALLALVAGLLVGLVDRDHPLEKLSWENARASFYGAVEDGMDATLHWVTADGDRTTEAETIYDEIFALARHGLASRGVDADTVDDVLGPIEARRRVATTPSRWKLRRVREALDDGVELEQAVHAMQHDYIATAARTESFAEWFDGGG
jgi:hypothetical protein